MWEGQGLCSPVRGFCCRAGVRAGAGRVRVVQLQAAVGCWMVGKLLGSEHAPLLSPFRGEVWVGEGPLFLLPLLPLLWLLQCPVAGMPWDPASLLSASLCG